MFTTCCSIFTAKVLCPSRHSTSSLNIDSEDCKRKIEESLFTVMDSKFNEMLSTIYNSVGDWLMTNTDLGKRITSGLTLNEVDKEITLKKVQRAAAKVVAKACNSSFQINCRDDYDAGRDRLVERTIIG
jgi:hypothetical protein